MHGFHLFLTECKNSDISETYLLARKICPTLAFYIYLLSLVPDGNFCFVSN